MARLFGATGQDRSTFRVGDKITSIALSPSGQRLASLAESDGRLQVWDIKRGRSLLLLQHPSHMHFHVAFSPDGNWLVASGPGGVWIWDGTPEQNEDLRDLTNRP